MVILLLLDYAQGKVGKEVFISDGGSCRRRSRVMVASRSRRSWITMRMLRRNGARLSSCSFSFSNCKVIYLVMKYFQFASHTIIGCAKGFISSKLC